MKYPKLRSWSASQSARSVLVLEENDISTTSIPRVSEAFKEAEQDQAWKPDAVFLVSSLVQQAWQVTCLRGEGFTAAVRDVCPADLVALTGR